MGNAVRKRVGLARSSSCNHEQRRKWAWSNSTMFDGATLFRIEFFEVSSSG
jgi:hypothetical protein